MLGNIIGDLTQQRANMVWQVAKKQSTNPTTNMVQAAGGKQDVVEISSSAPKSLTQADLITAIDAGSDIANMTNDYSASPETAAKLSESRVQAALAALCAADVNPDSGQTYWPVGLPSPTPSELREAYRRLSQKLTASAGVSEESAAQAQSTRTNLIEAYQNADFDSLAANYGYNVDEVFATAGDSQATASTASASAVYARMAYSS